MTTLTDIVNRLMPACPWAEGDNIPWDDPAFSERMLAEHLDQTHDLASRRSEQIDRQVDWIHRTVLGERPTRILDLTCGPGFYTTRLAKLGHQCRGIDFAPAAIAHAKEVAATEGVDCCYEQGDIRTAEWGSDFGLVMMLWGQFNVFRRSDAEAMLVRAREALADDGLLLLEPQTYQHVSSAGESPPTWQAASAGLFSDRPHLLLGEQFWDADSRTATHRYYVIDAATGEVTPHAMSTEAHTEGEYESALVAAGFGEVRFLPSLTGAADDTSPHVLAILART